MLLQQLTQITTLKEGRMKNAIMDTVEKRGADALIELPENTSYEDFVKTVIKKIKNTESVATEIPASELKEYIKSYFPKDEYVKSEAKKLPEGVTVEKDPKGGFNVKFKNKIIGHVLKLSDEWESEYFKTGSSWGCDSKEDAIDMIVSQLNLNEDEEVQATNKIINKGGDYVISLNEVNEQVTLINSRTKKDIVTMPLVIWKQLTR